MVQSYHAIGLKTSSLWVTFAPIPGLHQSLKYSFLVQNEEYFYKPTICKTGIILCCSFWTFQRFTITFKLDNKCCTSISKITTILIDHKGDLWAPYYRIIFELLDRLCQIIENPSFLLILQLSSFQSKIILWNDFWSSLNVILSKILKKGHFLKRNAKKQKTNNNNFLLLQL